MEPMVLPRSNSAPAIRTEQIPSGDSGSIQTLRKMRALVNDSLIDPLVINSAKDIVRFVLPRDYKAHVAAVRDFLVSHFLFCKDPRGVELLHAPRYMLEEIARRFYIMADCDDAAILAAALGKALGLRARFVATGFLGAAAPLAHVYAEIATPAGAWYPMDITRPQGRTLPRVTRTMTMEV